MSKKIEFLPGARSLQHHERILRGLLESLETENNKLKSDENHKFDISEVVCVCKYVYVYRDEKSLAWQVGVKSWVRHIGGGMCCIYIYVFGDGEL